ncbi:MAG: cellulase family glycosylhydrolase [Longilinea sp.]|nr:cellulase family glycosylhydrolase [Longilinea sp.]
MRLRTSGEWFLDELGRRVLLRGVNLGGSSKVPVSPDGSTHLPTDYADHRSVSFIGRPFPLEEADEHYRRLQSWGFNCLRFLTTWEAIEHAGPGQYDEAYLDYLYAVVKKARDYGFVVFIDPHQDVWSRMTGGDGAPGWTLELAGFEMGRLDAAEAAITMAGRYPAYPQMVWFSNYDRLACATMFTLFFAGNRFAPQVRMEGEPAQEFLQRHYIAAMEQVAERMAGLSHVLGYDTLNEPGSGYIGVENLDVIRFNTPGAPILTLFQAMTVGSGVPLVSRQMQREGGDVTVTLNPQGVSAWRSAEADIWRQHGVWDVGTDGKPQLLRPDYFAGTRFFADCMQPFVARFAQAMRRHDSDALIFVEGVPGVPEAMQVPMGIPVVNASHWYDEWTLFNKHYDPAFSMNWRESQIIMGESEVRQTFLEQLRRIKTMSQQSLGGVPTLIGEFGLPFDLDGGVASRTGDYSTHLSALHRYYGLLDELWLHATQWNYTADNCNAWGDRWNQEDFSIFSRDQQSDATDLNSGARALEGFSRPHLLACAGLPMEQSYDAQTGEFVLVIGAEPRPNLPTDVFVPRHAYPNGFDVWVSGGNTQYDEQKQVLHWLGMKVGVHELKIRRRT